MATQATPLAPVLATAALPLTAVLPTTAVPFTAVLPTTAVPFTAALPVAVTAVVVALAVALTGPALANTGMASAPMSIIVITDARIFASPGFEDSFCLDETAKIGLSSLAHCGAA